MRRTRRQSSSDDGGEAELLDSSDDRTSAPDRSSGVGVDGGVWRAGPVRSTIGKRRRAVITTAGPLQGRVWHPSTISSDAPTNCTTPGSIGVAKSNVR